MSEQYGDLFADDAPDVAIPPRSRLFNLPLASGEVAGDEEGQLSYLHRLARRHQVRIKDLMVKIILPETAIKGVPCSYRFTSEYARSVNGYGKYATELHGALSRLTLVPNLDRSTFLPWRHLFDGKGAGLLHPTRRWCPCCIADGSTSSVDGHAHPLLWSCAVITHCPIHGCPLVDACLKCQARQAQVSDSYVYGRCGACGASLGWRAGLLEDHQLSDRQLFVAKAVRQMIATGSNAIDIAKPENFAAGLRNVAKQTHGGVITQLARAIHFDYKVMSQWTLLENRPRFDSFIETCYRLGAMPLDLLQSSTQALEPQLRPGSLPLKRPFHKLTDAQLQQVKEAIATVVSSEETYLSAKQLAANFGTSVGHLRYQLPHDHRRLVEHRLRLKAAETQRKVAEKLATVKSVVRELAGHGNFISARKLCAALAAKGISVLCAQVRTAARAELHVIRNDWRSVKSPLRAAAVDAQGLSDSSSAPGGDFYA